MKRREFLGSCSLLAGIAALSQRAAGTSQGLQRYARTQLIDIHGAPIRYASIAGETNYVFQYPFAATPCFLLRLAAPVASAPSLRRDDGESYATGGHRTTARCRRLLGDLRAQARVPDARRFVHPLSAPALGYVVG